MYEINITFIYPAIKNSDNIIITNNEKRECSNIKYCIICGKQKLHKKFYGVFYN
jgi:hypothetical protein